MNLLFIGPPGAGKGTQALRVAEKLDIPHISTGEMFRHHVSSGTDFGKQVDEIMKSGGYVPDEITVAMLKGRLEMDDASKGFILDGFPRTAPQVMALDELIGTDGLDAVIVFNVDEEALVERLVARGRADDTEETIRARFGIYQDQTAPLLDIYNDRGLVINIDGVGDVNEVTDRIMTALPGAQYQITTTNIPPQAQQ